MEIGMMHTITCSHSLWKAQAGNIHVITTYSQGVSFSQLHWETLAGTENSRTWRYTKGNEVNGAVIPMLQKWNCSSCVCSPSLKLKQGILETKVSGNRTVKELHYEIFHKQIWVDSFLEIQVTLIFPWKQTNKDRHIYLFYKIDDMITSNFLKLIVVLFLYREGLLLSSLSWINHTMYNQKNHHLAQRGSLYIYIPYSHNCRTKYMFKIFTAVFRILHKELW